jgi:hypothetical protein
MLAAFSVVFLGTLALRVDWPNKRYRLHTLVLLTAVAPPLLWGLYVLLKPPGRLLWVWMLARVATDLRAVCDTQAQHISD